MEKQKRYAIIDIEATTFQKGSPYSARNKLCCIGISTNGISHCLDIEYSGRPYAAAIRTIKGILDQVDIIVGFNLKYDLGWLKRYGIRLDPGRHSIWDCQLAEFVLDNQSRAYPSLADSLSKYMLPAKSDVVATEYWEQGLDTLQVPWDILSSYNITDLEVTDALYQKQLQLVPDSKRSLLKLQNQDLLVLLDMEFNGIRFDTGAMAKEAEHVQASMLQVEAELQGFIDHWPRFNWDSGDHLSSLLYGGTVSVDVATPYEAVAKSGELKGQTVVRNRWETVSKIFPRLVEPLDGSELKKSTEGAGYWSVEESTLRQLRADKKTKRLIELLLTRSELEKYLSTYLIGIPAHAIKYDWQDGFIHGTFNQCRVVTGRLSSEKPNQQNFPKEIDQFIVSRFTPSA